MHRWRPGLSVCPAMVPFSSCTLRPLNTLMLNLKILGAGRIQNLISESFDISPPIAKFRANSATHGFLRRWQSRPTSEKKVKQPLPPSEIPHFVSLAAPFPKSTASASNLFRSTALPFFCATSKPIHVCKQATEKHSSSGEISEMPVYCTYEGTATSTKPSI